MEGAGISGTFVIPPHWEEEIKFPVSSTALLATIRADVGERLARCSPPEDRSYVDAYLDLEDRRLLRGHGLALRLRVSAGARVVEIKGGGTPIGGLIRRPEWRQAAPSGEFVRGRELGPGPVRHELARLGLLDDPLRHLFTCAIRRLVWSCPLPGGGSALIACDEGEVRAGTRRAVIREVEVESLAAAREAVHALAGELAARHGLVAGGASKFMAGLGLLGGGLPPDGAFL
ncbi:MAG: hypothetical protein HQL96_11675 [Magnetococcales bacterium]|nr:hypothetical protein [Magnetococcales bacterium]